MKKLAPVLALLALGAFSASAQAAPSAQGLSHRNACAVPAGDSARCYAQVLTNSDGSTFSPHARPTSFSGWTPADLKSAYKLPTFSSATPPTVAIVDAFDDPSAESDLAKYRAKYGLGDCTTANHCFKKINQNGVEGSYPTPNKGWAEEIALDLDMVSAACPACHILLVEANDNYFDNLAAAVDRAASTPGVLAISNSYGGPEFLGQGSYDSHYDHAGIAITVSSGDNGYGAEFPASSPTVTAVGGTSLSKASNSRGWSETAWSGAGSGCSAYEAKPSWQTDANCDNRTVADVSAVANPNTGVAVYSTYGGDPGWMVFGGTSASSPLIGAVYAMGGVPADLGGASLPYSHTGSLFDVTSGSNGRCTARRSTVGAYLCTAGAGYDGPTGLGTPNGASAF
jgi:subtilase family serine protease